MLTVIDAFSKKAWVEAVKRKTGENVTNAMKNILNKSKQTPKNLQTDDGKEFFNVPFKKLMISKKINLYSTFSTLKSSIVERFNRTLKGMMWKEFSFKGSYKWIDDYKNLVDKYNNKLHRTIQMTPNQVNSSNESYLLKSAYNNLKTFHKPKFKLNDYVRISKYRHVFDKGYTPNWTTEIFKIKYIRNTNPTTYILEDYQGEEIKGGFYEYELLKTNLTQTYLVEKILKKHKNKAFVKWLGFSSDHNSWIDVDDLV